MGMENKQPQYWQSVIVAAEELDLQRAAQRLRIPVTELSRQISALEAELGCPIFQRRRSSLLLLPDSARLLMDIRRRLMAYMSRNLPGRSGRPLVLGYSPHVNPELLESVRRRWQDRQQPWRELSVFSIEQIRLLREGMLDAGLLIYPLAAVGVTIVPSYCERLLAALPAAHARAADPLPLRLPELDGLPMISLSPALHRPLVERMLQLCRLHEVEPEIAYEAYHISEAISLVSEGRGFCFVRECDRRFASAQVKFLPLYGEPVVLLTGIACLPDSPLQIII